MHRKGEGAAVLGVNAAWLVLIIGIFLIAYVLLLPPGEREKLITDPASVGEDTNFGPLPSYGSSGSGSYGTTSSGTRLAPKFGLLSVAPGPVEAISGNIFSKPLASVNLFSLEERNIENLAGTLRVVRSAFSDKPKRVLFRLDNFQDIKSLKLLFFVAQEEGDLIISFNDVEIFNGKVSPEDLPLELPPSLIKRSNKIEFSVSSPGLFGTNEYVLNNVQVLKQADVQNRKETRTFTLTTSQKQNLGTTTLYYSVNCFTATELANLFITLNGKLISQNLVVCDAREVSLDLNSLDLIAGRNVLGFSIDKGRFVLENVLLEGEFSNTQFPSYNFQIGSQEEDTIFRGGRVILELIFDRPNYPKAGLITVNGFRIPMETFGNDFFVDITPYVNIGTNSVSVFPNTNMNILNLNTFIA